MGEGAWSGEIENLEGTMWREEAGFLTTADSELEN